MCSTPKGSNTRKSLTIANHSFSSGMAPSEFKRMIERANRAEENREARLKQKKVLLKQQTGPHEQPKIINDKVNLFSLFKRLYHSINIH